jgi:hypothetical protein
MTYFRTTVITFYCALIFSACSAAATKSEWSGATSSKLQAAKHQAKLKWSKVIAGAITDLNVTADGEHVALSLVPDPDGGSDRNPYLVLYKKNGDLVLKKKLPARVRYQALSDQHKLVVLSTYDEKLLTVDFEGNQKWERAIHCKPSVLDSHSKIHCFHDDESKSKVAFEVLELFTGKTIAQLPVQSDALIVKVSQDEFNVGVGFSNSKVMLTTQKGQPVWEKLLQGEIVDLAVTSALPASIFVLHYTVKKGKREGQKLTQIQNGNILKEWDLPFHSEQLSLNSKGDLISLYGNNPHGQRLVVLSTEGSAILEKWRFEEKHFADFSSSPFFHEQELWVGFEDVYTQGERVNHLFGFSGQGQLLYDIVLKPQDGAFLFGVGGRTKSKRTLFLATDQNRLDVYEMATLP